MKLNISSRTSYLRDELKILSTGAKSFDIEYGRWLEEHNRQVNELRAAVNAHASDTDLRTIVDGITTQFDEIFKIKGVAAKADVFHILSGMWKTPAERCFMWLGGFRPSEILKVKICIYHRDICICCKIIYFIMYIPANSEVACVPLKTLRIMFAKVPLFEMLSEFLKLAPFMCIESTPNLICIFNKKLLF